MVPLRSSPSRATADTRAQRLVRLAIETAEEGLAAGELPIGAVVALGDEVLGRAYTQEKRQGRWLVHADLLAMVEADRHLGQRPRNAPLVMAVTLEPCLMCLGAAMTLRVSEIYFGLESPSDGAATLAGTWRPEPPEPPQRPELPFTRVPKLVGGMGRLECRALFARYAATEISPGLRDFASQLAALPESSTF